MHAIRSIRWTVVASIVAALFLVPVSISSAGSVELDGVCASGECKTKAGSHCYDDGTAYPDARNIINVID